MLSLAGLFGEHLWKDGGTGESMCFVEYIVHIPLYKASTDESAHGNVPL